MGVLIWMDWRPGGWSPFRCCRSFALITPVVPDPRARVVPHRGALDSRASMRYLQERITGHVHRAALSPRGQGLPALDEIDRKHRDANVGVDFYYAVFYPAIELVTPWAASLIIWVGGRLGRRRDADARLARGVSAVLRSASSGRSATCRRKVPTFCSGASAPSSASSRWLDTPVGAPKRQWGWRRSGVIGVRARVVCLSRGRGRCSKDGVLPLEPGQRIWPSSCHGSGKDDHRELLLRFYDVQRADQIDGVDIREMDTASLRSSLPSWLPDVHLFSGRLPAHQAGFRSRSPTRG